MRRRKPRVVWLPPTNANSLDSGTGTNGYQIFAVDVAGTTVGTFAVGEIPLVIDAEDDDPLGAGTVTLADVESSGYRLRRIVGKIFCFQRQRQDINGPPDKVLVTAGIIVRRTDPTSGLSLALGNANAAELLSPGQIRNFADPWIWRRTWVLSDESSVGQAAQFPRQASSNIGPEGPCAGNLDGPHVDQKTARIIGPEERLFLNVSSTILNPGADGQVTASTLVVTDLRVLASMRTSTGNRRNASR